MVDAADLKSAGGDTVWVRIPPALYLWPAFRAIFCCLPRRNARCLFRTVAWSSMLLDEIQAVCTDWERQHGEPVWSEGDQLVVGVSGGPDSLALLHALIFGALQPREYITVGHFNHRLRESAEREATFVRRICAEWGVRCVVGEKDVGAWARSEGYSIEEAGRLARYRFLGELAENAGSTRVLVGHTADDQVETVLMHFVRGAGLDGLRGMQLVSPMPGKGAINLVRPLLATSRDEVEAYCRRHNLTPVWDASNEDQTFFRNRLRHELLPLLAEYNPQIKERILNLAEVTRGAVALLEALEQEAWEALLEAQGVGWLRVNLARWRALPLALRRRTLRYAIHLLHRSLRDLSFRTVEAARRIAEEGDAGSVATLPGDMELLVEYDTWRLALPTATVPPSGPQLDAAEAQPLAVPGTMALANGWRLESAYVEEQPPQQVDYRQQNPWRVCLDAERAGSLVVRGRREGERFQPLGLEGHSVRVSEFMINQKIPAELRARWPIIANEEHVLWIVGQRIDERAKVTAATRQILLLHCFRESSTVGDLDDLLE